ncbi:toll/interleukin-1 receptor domain-containing protein [Paracoccus caeni]|uniref:Toll/interleukin-1 receptor domain-containing protein n=1 Tax=Paracoccus caeni TaxID=657651 RepID=A0A934VUQ3_9RHOB|nr:toll/interleukin-1 receptor domain-containing protein [Paracoccus caeni]MBK4216061.1 toll/interleukin-1 receptor domain-containing protein [Paracoccus caeni]
MGEELNSWKFEVVESSCVAVTAGPFAGRIGFNDDDEWIGRDWLLKYGSYAAFSDYDAVLWHEALAHDDDYLPLENEREIGTACAYVYFGDPVITKGYFIIPHSHLRKAMMSDLFSRYHVIMEQLGGRKYGIKKISSQHSLDILNEYAFIVNELLEREISRMTSPRAGTKVFLCHASEDKEIVRRIYRDLISFELSPWMDEFEIKIGESIVDKINEAATVSDFAIFFISEASLGKAWVKKEWNAFLARSLSGNGPKIIPARLDNAEIPAIIADIRYADFRESYIEPLNEIIRALPQQT